ncbi:conserved hypothetical protein, partial [Ricinus communis]
MVVFAVDHEGEGVHEFHRLVEVAEHEFTFETGAVDVPVRNLGQQRLDGGIVQRGRAVHA